MPRVRREQYADVVNRVVEVMRMIRRDLIELNGKMDMLFSVLASIRNEQLEQRTDLAGLRRRTEPKREARRR